MVSLEKLNESGQAVDQQSKKIDQAGFNLEAYRQVCQSIDATIERRLSMNRFYLSIVTAIAAGYGLVVSSDKISENIEYKLILSLSVIGISICIIWISQIIRSRNLSSVKHQIAIEIEKEISIKNLTIEEKMVSNVKGFYEHTISEIFIPSVFIVVTLLNLIS
jgi:hypothetical protein